VRFERHDVEHAEDLVREPAALDPIGRDPHGHDGRRVGEGLDRPGIVDRSLEGGADGLALDLDAPEAAGIDIDDACISRACIRSSQGRLLSAR
jgi:hypothetical protein